MRLEPRCCRTSIWYTIFVVVVMVVLVDIQKMELVLTNIFTLCWQYIPRDLVNLVVSHLAQKETCPHLRATRRFLEGLGIGRAAPYKKRGVDIPIFHVLEGPPPDPTKKVFDLIIGIFSHPPRARSIDPGHFVGNCFWLGTDFCRTS